MWISFYGIVRVALLTVVVMPVIFFAQGKQPALQPAETRPSGVSFPVEHQLDRAAAFIAEYRNAFKDFTADETKTIEVYEKIGRVFQSRHIVSGFVIYQSQRDKTRIDEFRFAREVDGKLLPNRQEEVEKLFSRLGKLKSVDEELNRIRSESTKYDFGYTSTGYVANKGIPLYEEFRKSFRFEMQGNEKIEGHETLVFKYEQIEPRNELFHLSLQENLKPSEPRLHGRLWLDAESGQLWREEYAITFRSLYSSKPLVFLQARSEYRPSQFDLYLPRHIEVSFYAHELVRNGNGIQSYRRARSINDYQEFKRFTVTLKD